MKTENLPSERSLMWVKRIDYTLIAVLSVFCLKYVTFYGRSFAEQFVKFPFLNFPIFVGEFLLAFCLLLSLVRMALARQKLKSWCGIVVAFYGFVLVKAVVGYIHFGPLALRDAALFYYSLFVLIGYVCYRPEVFTGWMSFFFYLGLFWLAFDSKYNEYWLIPRIFIALALAYNTSDRRLGALMAMGILIFTPYQYFLNTSRSVFLGGFVAIAFLLAVLPFLLKSKDMQRKLVVCNLFLISCLGAYIFHFSGSKPAQGLLALDKLKMISQQTMQVIEKKKKTYTPVEMSKVMIFSPNNEAPSVENDVREQEKINVTENQEDIKEQAESNEKKGLRSGVLSEQSESDSIHQMKLGNSLFRLLLWKDAVNEMSQERKIFGLNFGKPFRSESLEIIRSAVNEWKRDGWIAMHNSYLNILYRAGIVGLLYITFMFLGFGYMVKTFIVNRSVPGLLVCASMLVPFVASFFAVSLEVPYLAIPMWTLYGLTLRAASNKRLESKTI